MADEKPKTVTVESLELHTYEGKSYPVGSTYDIDEQYADSVQAQGKAVRVDRAAYAKSAEKTGKRSTAAAPMTTTSKSSRALVKPRKAKK